MEKEFAEFVQKLKDAAGGNLKSVILYGSSVSGEFQAKHSHLDILVVIERTGITQIDTLQPSIEWWIRKNNSEPRVFTAEELQRSADVFPIELLDMKELHRVLFGEDVLEKLTIPLRYHKLQIERELRTNSLRLRQALLVAPKKAKARLGIMVSSVSSFVALFRHALIALGEVPATNKRDAIDRMARIAGCDPSGFHAVLDFREGKRSEEDFDIAGTIRGYVELVEKVTNEVDRRLDANS